jgi:hypothetical protein
VLHKFQKVKARTAAPRELAVHDNVSVRVAHGMRACVPRADASSLAIHANAGCGPREPVFHW